MIAFFKLLYLLAGGSVRCAACGHTVKLEGIVGHCKIRHPEIMDVN